MIKYDGLDGEFDQQEAGLSIHELVPEKGMLRALLARAVADLKDPNLATREDAREWLFESERTGPFTFRWVCSHLDLDHSWLVKNLNEMQKIGVKMRFRLGHKPREVRV